KIPELESIARISLRSTYMVRREKITSQESVTSADPNIFDLLQLPTLYGDLKTALAQPGSIVIPLSMARKYFGTDNVLGRTLIVDKSHPLRVTAVVADLPANASNLKTTSYVSSKAQWTALGQADSAHKPLEDVDSQTFMRLAPGASVPDIQARLAGLDRFLLTMPPSIHARSRLIPIETLHVDPAFSPGVLDRLAAFTGLAAAILILSVIHFVNLVTARAARRGGDVGVGKATGAAR